MQLFGTAGQGPGESGFVPGSRRYKQNNCSVNRARQRAVPRQLCGLGVQLFVSGPVPGEHLRLSRTIVRPPGKKRRQPLAAFPNILMNLGFPPESFVDVFKNL